MGVSTGHFWCENLEEKKLGFDSRAQKLEKMGYGITVLCIIYYAPIPIYLLTYTHTVYQILLILDPGSLWPFSLKFFPLYNLISSIDLLMDLC